MRDEHTQVSDATREAEAEEADAPHRADRPPTAEEEEAVEGRPVDPDVRAHYREMTELGAEEVGEGRIP
jgi:hypothetical protein